MELPRVDALVDMSVEKWFAPVHLRRWDSLSFEPPTLRARPDGTAMN
jgi:hypothetical protein